MEEYSKDEVTPPDAFGIVEAGVFRSNIPYHANFSFLRKLKLKTVVVLSPERPVRAVTEFLDENGIDMIHLGKLTWSSASWKPMSDEMLKEGLQYVLDVERHPIMVTCTFGIYQTGTLVGCLRRLQNWNLNAILSEHNMYGGERTRYFNVLLIEIFDLDLVTLPLNLPEWFVRQQMMQAAEAMESKAVMK
ncbi:hypothetical protein SARC_07577 [Sphaeroforma arctica JP610]|uniref:Tyrosine-protein phosphatase domain-containing protein n=1 Tax=Sphaeroforma arctica JP610 TaxID=667725 RepID=A0A0L0FVT4_9EUKA|nr:hypothetical protein SARC_07577 [Sphaeroforma arctica JP610]KNC80048.1 hypothetical protein SARC_07577 [Sphaeroforma arctica JP610]|eukprot:XP_014153950.1 hypothetical protein SARC_07577 [Sphaeroforma arctica JP610]